MIVMVVALLVVSAQTEQQARTCRLQQRWFEGDLYSWEELSLARDGTGDWTWGDRKGSQRTVDFTWRRDGSTLRIWAGADRRRVHFTLERIARDQCTLTLDQPPVAEAAATMFYGE